ncbi:uncharacterized protein LOC120345911 isoform X2 [Styela clava]
MKISIVFVVNYVIASGWCQDKTVFHCSPKPGCQIAQCDPVAVGWDRPGFNIDEHLHDNEFPITCKSNSTVIGWLDFVSRNLDITNIRMGLNKLENKFDKKIENFEKKISGNLEYGNQSEEQSNKINNLLRSTTRQSAEIRELRKDLVEIQEVNENLVEDNNMMKKAISSIEQRLAVAEKQISNGIESETKLKPTPSPENCKFKVGNICYFAVIIGYRDVNYSKAVDICKKRNADVGLVRDKQSYYTIMNYLRWNVTRNKIWTGILFDPMTGCVTPADSFTKWLPNYPQTGIDNKDQTNVYLYVHSQPNDGYQGMTNIKPIEKVDGVICEILI